MSRMMNWHFIPSHWSIFTLGVSVILSTGLWGGWDFDLSVFLRHSHLRSHTVLTQSRQMLLPTSNQGNQWSVSKFSITDTLIDSKLMNNGEKRRAYQTRQNWNEVGHYPLYFKKEKGGTLELVWRIKILARAVTSFDTDRSFGCHFEVWTSGKRLIFFWRTSRR